MKVAVSACGQDLSGMVDPRFGRCPYFLVVDIESKAVEAVPNGGVGSAHGAGIQAAQLVASLGVKAVLTGNVGPNAYSALSASGISVLTGVSGTAAEAVERFKRGELDAASSPTVGGHFGTGGRGGGMGRGQGRGRGGPPRG